jgi:hypothetical protein
MSLLLLSPRLSLSLHLSPLFVPSAFLLLSLVFSLSSLSLPLCFFPLSLSLYLFPSTSFSLSHSLCLFPSVFFHLSLRSFSPRCLSPICFSPCVAPPPSFSPSCISLCIFGLLFLLNASSPLSLSFRLSSYVSFLLLSICFPPSPLYFFPLFLVCLSPFIFGLLFPLLSFLMLLSPCLFHPVFLSLSLPSASPLSFHCLSPSLWVSLLHLSPLSLPPCLSPIYKIAVIAKITLTAIMAFMK